MKPSYQRVVFGFVAVCGFGIGACSSSNHVVFPETCEDVRESALDETGIDPENGIYTLYVDGDESKPWDAYCHNMHLSDPSEFLPVDEELNYSEVSIDPVEGIPTATRTAFRRYRIDPISLEIDLLDDTFATTDGDTEIIPDDRDHIPAGWAQYGSGDLDGGAAAEAKIDLEETSFAFDESILNDFFCVVIGIGDDAGSDFSIASDLTSFELSAASSGITNRVKTVADCDHLGAADAPEETDYTVAELPLQYVAQ